MLDSLRDRYNLSNRRRHGDVQEYPFIINLFPDLYQDVNGKYVTAPYQLIIAASDTVTVPFILPRDSIYKTLYFRFDVTAPYESAATGLVYVSSRLTDIAISLVHKSGGDRTHVALEQLNVFCGTNSGFAQVKVPYIHPKEGSLVMQFKNLFPVERRVSGWFYGTKVAS